MRDCDKKTKKDRTNPKLVVSLCSGFVALAMLTGVAVFTASASGVSQNRPKTVKAAEVTQSQSDYRDILLAQQRSDNMTKVKSSGSGTQLAAGAQDSRKTADSSSQDEAYKRNYIYYVPAQAHKTVKNKEDLTGRYIEKENKNIQIEFSKNDNKSYRCVVTKDESEKGKAVYEFICTTGDSYLTYTGGIRYRITQNAVTKALEKKQESKDHCGKIYLSESGLTWTDSDGSHGTFTQITD